MNKVKWGNCSGYIIDSKDNHDVINCEVCKFKHIIPIPSKSQIDEMYSDDYYKLDKPNYIKEAKKDEEWWKLAYNNRYDSFESILPSNRRKLLDIGSGPGFFLLQGKHRGWTVKGIEPSNSPYEYSKHSLNLDVENIFFDAGWVKKLRSILYLLKIGLIFLGIILITILIVVIGNTIRLQTLTHKDEIEVSKLIGATDSFIKRPFIYSGLIYGLGGGIITISALKITIEIFNKTAINLEAMLGGTFILNNLLWQQNLIILLIAMLIGCFASFFAAQQSIKKFEIFK